MATFYSRCLQDLPRISVLCLWGCICTTTLFYIMLHTVVEWVNVQLLADTVLALVIVTILLLMAFPTSLQNAMKCLQVANLV